MAVAGDLAGIPAQIRVQSYRTIRAICSDNAKPVGMVRTCSVYWGRTGTGKSRRAWEEAGMDAYTKDPNTKFWCGYNGQRNVVLDEFRGRIDVSHLLRWLDRYPVNVEIKGSSVPLCAERIWITSNLDPRTWYPELDEETVLALVRRLNITHFLYFFMSIRKHFKHIKKAVGAVIAVKQATKRKSRSKTKTKTKKKNKFRVVGRSDDICDSSHTVVINQKPQKCASGKWLYTQTHNEVFNSIAGTQATPILAMGTYEQINVSSGVSYTGLQSQVGVRLLNPTLGTAAGPYLGATTNPTTDAFVITDMFMDIELASWSDTAQTLHAYIYVAKAGVQDHIETLWARGLQQQGHGKGIMTLLTAPLNLGVAGYGSRIEPKSSPQEANEYIKQAYTFKKKVEINLESGATHKMRLHIIANKRMKTSELDHATTNGDLTIGGLTTMIQWTLRGAVVDDTTGVAKPTFASTKVGVITRNTYVCRPVRSPIGDKTVGIHSYNVPTGAALANQGMIDEIGDIDIVKSC